MVRMAMGDDDVAKFFARSADLLHGTQNSSGVSPIAGINQDQFLLVRNQKCVDDAKAQFVKRRKNQPDRQFSFTRKGRRPWQICRRGQSPDHDFVTSR